MKIKNLVTLLVGSLLAPSLIFATIPKSNSEFNKTVSAASRYVPAGKSFNIQINNKSYNDLSYFYSNSESNGQNRYLEHNVKSGKKTWDWGWCAKDTQNSMELQTFIKNTGLWETVVVVWNVQKVSSGFQFGLKIFWNEASTLWVKNPEWNKQQWKEIDVDQYLQGNKFSYNMRFENGGIYDYSGGENKVILKYNGKSPIIPITPASKPWIPLGPSGTPISPINPPLQNNLVVSRASNKLPLSVTGLALGISNASNNELTYFYSSLANNGQNRWYKHDVKPGKDTWDWGWCSLNTQNSIEMQMFDNIRKSWYTLVFVWNGYEPNTDNLFHLKIYWVKNDTLWTKNPEWKKPQWNLLRWSYNAWDLSYHLHLQFRDDGIYANSFKAHYDKFLLFN